MTFLHSVNPYNGLLINKYVTQSDAELESILTSSLEAGASWKRRSHAERLFCLSALEAQLQRHRDEAAKLMVAEMGKLHREALAEIDKCISLCSYYQAAGLSVLQGRTIKSDAGRSGVFYEPMGVVLGIMPWNFPFWQAFRFLVPAILAGNTVLLKHASNVTGCSIFIENLFAHSFPAKVMRSIILAGPQMDKLVTHPAVAAVSLTGSEAVGRHVAGLAAAALKPLVLELGGSDPLIVFEDADLELAARVACISRFQNAGQSCIAAKRFIVHRKVKSTFMDLLQKQMKALDGGDPLLPHTGMAPLAKPEFAIELHEQVERTLQEGASLVVGGSYSSTAPAFYPATLLDDVTSQMTAAKEELFGPVAAILTFAEQEEAIYLANSTRFGLGSSVFTADAELIAFCKNELNAGSVYVNGMMKSHPALPFGGTKASGFGRELSTEGLVAFCQLKTFWEKE